MTNRFFDIKHKELLSRCPPDVDSIDWKRFRKKFAQAERFVELDDPLQLDVELNGGCNMKCPFCIHGYGDKIPYKKMSIADYHRII